MLYEMLSGRPPFDGPSAVEIAHAVLHQKPPVLSGSAAIVAADRVIHQALAKRAEDRYQDAAAMSRDLRGVLTTADAAEPVKAQQVPRLIVLPFRMLRPDEDTEFLAFSLPEAITMSLSGLGSIVVRSALAGGQFATESPDLRALATHAEVDLVLVGSLLRGGDTLQVNAQLLEAPGGTVVWSERTQVAWQDIFHLQEDLTRRIVGSLAQPLSAKEEQRLHRDAPASAAAYELYLRANKLANMPSEWETARDLYLECVEQDPNYAPAWARLGRLQRVVAKIQGRTLTEVEHGYAEAERSFERALSLNPDLAVAHREYAALEIEQGRAREALVRLLARIDADGGNANLFAGLVLACRYCGLLEASLAAHEHARRLDPTVNTSHLDTLFCLGRYDEVLEQTSVVDGADVGNFVIRAACLMRAGRDADAVAVLDRLETGLLRGVGGRFLRFMRAAVNLDANNPDVDAALADVDSWKDPEMHYACACLLARLGHGERALAFLARAVEGGFYCAPAIAQDPLFDPLRADPEFIRLLRLAQSRHRDASAAFTDAGGERLLGISLS